MRGDEERAAVGTLGLSYTSTISCWLRPVLMVRMPVSVERWSAYSTSCPQASVGLPDGGAREMGGASSRADRGSSVSEERMLVVVWLCFRGRMLT
jgi:hypothetical protein